MDFPEKDEPLFWRVFGKLTCCEDDPWLETLLIAVGMTGLGVLSIWFVQHWMSPGALRIFIFWFIFTFFLAKAWNIVDCGGPIPTAIMGVFVAIFLDAWDAEKFQNMMESIRDAQRKNG